VVIWRTHPAMSLAGSSNGGNDADVTDREDDARSTELVANRDGRVTIPAQMRRAAGLEPGNRLVVYVEHGRVVIEERDHLLARVQREAIEAAAAADQSDSVVDELIAERRAEAAREADDPPGPAPDTGAAGRAQ